MGVCLYILTWWLARRHTCISSMGLSSWSVLFPFSYCHFRLKTDIATPWWHKVTQTDLLNVFWKIKEMSHFHNLVEYSTNLEWVTPSICRLLHEYNYISMHLFSRKSASFSEHFHPTSPFCKRSATRGSKQKFGEFPGFTPLIRIPLRAHGPHCLRKACILYAPVQPSMRWSAPYTWSRNV